ncbi:MAG: hypothetical protein IT534_10975 [Bauldia sp.]|nr:hypothetical protein [Bauldia sp.]
MPWPNQKAGRSDFREMRVALGRLEGKVGQNHGDLTSRMDNLRQAINGESVLGRSAAAT